MRTFLLLLLLSGCASEAEFASQNATWTPNYPPRYVYVADVHQTCVLAGSRYLKGDIINGCSDPWGRVVPKNCTIYLPHNPPRWLVEHEELHCKYGGFHK